MMNVDRLESTDALSGLKHQYLHQTTAPLDGMWLCGFVPVAQHYGFSIDGDLVGFCCMNTEGYLLQFFVRPEFQEESSSLFEAIVTGQVPALGNVSGAFVSTAEPLYLSQCFDHLSSFEVNALMYQQDEKAMATTAAADSKLALTALEPQQLSEAVEFVAASIGAPESWLEGYLSNLIRRRELFGVRQHGTLIATGERRGYDEYQTGYADVGVIVAKSERGRGLATQILRQLAALNEKIGLKSICSTEKANVAAQKAITRAGFVDRNRIIQFNA